ncbi:MAG: hypothetical protein ABFD81_10220 [Syntrophaceae bacterium]
MFDIGLLILIICAVIACLFVLDKGYDLVMWARYEWRRVDLGVFRADRDLWHARRR